MIKRLLLLLPLVSLAACTSAERHPPAPASPFAVVLAEYSAPVAMGAALEGSIGGWDESISLKTWIQGWTRRPRRTDVDNDFVNYVLHPVSGSETHLLARKHGWTFMEAFWFDVFSSITWEYVFENLYERPSQTDLLVTAPGGALIGEIRWQLYQAGFLPGLMDPLGHHGKPFMEITSEGFFFGLDRGF